MQSRSSSEGTSPSGTQVDGTHACILLNIAWNREKMSAPAIAKDYWRLAENATIKDVLYAVRSDETTHRFVNHSLGNLHPNDVNPFAIREPDMHVKGRTIEYVHSLY